MNLIYAYPSNLDRTFVRSLQIAQTVNSMAETGLNVFFIKGKNYSSVSDEDKFHQFGIKIHKNLRIINTYMLCSQKTKKIRFSWNFLGYRLILRKIIKLLKKQVVEVIYTRDLRLAKLLLNARRSFKNTLIVYEAHDYFNVSLKYEKKRKLRKFMDDEKFVIEHVDGLVAVSPYISSAIKESAFKKTPSVLTAPNGVDLSMFKPVQVQKNLKSVTYTGGLYPWKGVDLAIKAMQYTDQDILLTIIGSKGENDPDTASLNSLIQSLGLSYKVKILPFMPQKELRELFKSSRALLIPLTDDNPISCLFTSPVKSFEYMASGIPIIATNVPAINWFLHNRKNALLVNPNDPKAFAQAIQELIMNYDLGKKLAERAFKDVQKYSWKRRGEKIAQWIDELVSQDS